MFLSKQVFSKSISIFFFCKACFLDKLNNIQHVYIITRVNRKRYGTTMTGISLLCPKRNGYSMSRARIASKNCVGQNCIVYLLYVHKLKLLLEQEGAVCMILHMFMMYCIVIGYRYDVGLAKIRHRYTYRRFENP
jgi:hypothetical protein